MEQGVIAVAICKLPEHLNVLSPITHRQERMVKFVSIEDTVGVGVRGFEHPQQSIARQFL